MQTPNNEPKMIRLPPRPAADGPAPAKGKITRRKPADDSELTLPQTVTEELTERPRRRADMPRNDF